MTQLAPISPPSAALAPASQRTQSLLHAWLMTSLGLLIVGVTGVDLQIVQRYDFLRTSCLVAGIVAGCGAAFSFGGAMHYLDAALAAPMAWYWKILLFLHKRLLMLLQLLMTLVALAAIGAMVFNWKIPGPDWRHLFTGPDYSVTVEAEE